jgi:hypothetical protein
MIGQNLFEAFARSYEPPSWIIEDLQREPSPEIQFELNAAIEGVSTGAIAALDKDSRAQAEILFSTADPDKQARLYIVSQAAVERIERTRLNLAVKLGATPPYNHPALRGIIVDKEGLVPLSAFEIEGDALCVNDHAFFVLLPLPGSNANYWLLQELRRSDLLDSVKVRLDPLLHGPAGQLSGRFYRATIYGQELDWKRIRQLRQVEHGSWMPGKLSRRYLKTDYAWVPHEREVDFLCEELPIAAEAATRGARYLHAVYDKGTDQIKHLDGAIRIMTPAQLALRAAEHVRNSGKVGVRIKTFRTDQPISPSTLSGIAQAFFFWNYDVARYFGAPVHPDF